MVNLTEIVSEFASKTNIKKNENDVYLSVNNILKNKLKIDNDIDINKITNISENNKKLLLFLVSDSGADVLKMLQSTKSIT
jgi:hypothetical protein